MGFCYNNFSMYKVVVSYSDGHIDELNDEFKELNQALSFAVSYVGHLEDNDEFRNTFNCGSRKKPYFQIVEYQGEHSNVVLDSRKGRR